MGIETEQVEEFKKTIEAAKESGDIANFAEKTTEFVDILLKGVTSCLDSLDFSAAEEYFAMACKYRVELLQSYMSVGFNKLGSMEYALASECFNLAYGGSVRLHERFEEILRIIEEKQGAPEAFYDDVKEALISVEQHCTLLNAWHNLALGQLNRLNRSPDVAVEHLKIAHDDFAAAYKETDEGIFQFMSDYSNCLQVTMGATENLYRGNLNMAKQQFLQAKIAMEDVLEKTLPEYVGKEDEGYQNIESGVKVDLKGIETLYYLCDARDQFNRLNFSLAREQYDKLCKISAEAIESSLDVLPQQVRDVSAGDYHVYCGHKCLAEAELLREQEKWDEASQAYKEAREEWEQSAMSYAKSRIPQASALQETVSNLSASLDVFRAQCERERQLKSKIKKLEDDIGDLMQSVRAAIKPMGTTINNTQEMASTFQASIQFSITIENQVKQNIEELVKQLLNLPIGDTAKQDIKEKGNEIVNSTEHGHQFLDSVKKFTKNVAGIIKSVGEAARPILPLVQALSIFTGVPIPPIL